jgi:hypothetical protein
VAEVARAAHPPTQPGRVGRPPAGNALCVHHAPTSQAGSGCTTFCGECHLVATPEGLSVGRAPPGADC